MLTRKEILDKLLFKIFLLEISYDKELIEYINKFTYEINTILEIINDHRLNKFFENMNKNNIYEYRMLFKKALEEVE